MFSKLLSRTIFLLQGKIKPTSIKRVGYVEITLYQEDGGVHFCNALSSLSRASTQRAPVSVCSFFQNGACVFKKSIMNSQAEKASPRCFDATTTRTI